MAKANFRQQKRQKELIRKQKQDERLRRRGEHPVANPLDSGTVRPPGGGT